MISPVSSVSFKANPAAMPQDPISRPGSFSQPVAMHEAPHKKKHGVGKALAKLVVAALVVGGGLILGFKKNAFKVLDEAALKDAKFMQKVGHKLGKWGKSLDEHVWSKVTKLFSRKSEDVTEAAETVAETVSEAAAKAS